LAGLLRLSYEPMLAWRLDGAIEFWNAGAQRLYGFTPDQAIGQVSHSLLQTKFPLQFVQLRSQLLNSRYWSGELRHICEDGREVIVDSRMQLFDDTVLEVNRDITDVKALSETQQLLIAELNHRVKNTLATVQAIAHQTLRRAKDPPEFVASFTGRIQSLSRVDTLLSNSGWQGTDLHALLRDQLLAGAVDETRVTAWGPFVRLGPQMALHLALMLHELGTNAIKHGALSSTAGIVTISWTVEDAMLHIRWAERGGPTPVAPTSRGFGKRLIEETAKSQGGSAQMSLEIQGVFWNVAMPLPEGKIDRAASFVTDLIGIKPASEVSPADTTATIAGKRFLVVEDEPLVALDIVAALEYVGAKVVGQSGTLCDALDLIESTPVDAAVLDANLHGQSVDQIAAALTRRNVPFLFVTGYRRESLPQAFVNADVIAKPFNWQQLIDGAATILAQPAEVSYLRR